MLNNLPLHTPLTPGVGSKGYYLSFPKEVMLHVKLTGMKQRTHCKPEIGVSDPGPMGPLAFKFLPKIYTVLKMTHIALNILFYYNSKPFFI